MSDLLNILVLMSIWRTSRLFLGRKDARMLCIKWFRRFLLCILSGLFMPHCENVTIPSYNCDTSSLAKKFNIFFTSVGSTIASKVQKLALQHDLKISDNNACITASGYTFSFHKVSERWKCYHSRLYHQTKPLNWIKFLQSVIKDSLPVTLLFDE